MTEAKRIAELENRLEHMQEALLAMSSFHDQVSARFARLEAENAELRERIRHKAGIGVVVDLEEVV
jgi:prefoldin subunit 5